VWPPPSSELWSAIAGLRGSHDPPPAASTPPRRRSRRRTALLLEGDVTLDRARRAAAAGGPRDWIVERVQRVRGTAEERKQLDRLGVRWSVLAPVEVRAVVVSPVLLRARNRWEKWFSGAAIWNADSSAWNPRELTAKRVTAQEPDSSMVRSRSVRREHRRTERRRPGGAPP
jgi:hypothetical protein